MRPRRGEKKYLVLYECGDEEVRAWAGHRWRQSSSEAVVMCPGCLFVWPIVFLNFDIDTFDVRRPATTLTAVVLASYNEMTVEAIFPEYCILRENNNSRSYPKAKVSKSKSRTFHA